MIKKIINDLDTKMIIGILFIILIILSGSILIMLNYSSDSEPDIIEDENLTKDEVVHNVNEQINYIESYDINKNVSLISNNSSNPDIYIDKYEINSNNLNDSYENTTIQINNESHTYETYNFQDTEYLSSDDSWDVFSDVENKQIFDNIEIINDNNLENYNMTYDEDNEEYIFKLLNNNDKSINILNNLITENQMNKLNNEFIFTSTSQTEYIVTIDNSYNIKSINITSDLYMEDKSYNSNIEINNINTDVESITLPDELTSNDNIYSNEYYAFLDISQTTNNNVKITIQEDVSDIVEDIRIESRKDTFYISGQIDDSITINANEDFDTQAPNIRIIADMNNGDSRIVGEYKISDTINVEDEDNN